MPKVETQELNTPPPGTQVLGADALKNTLDKAADILGGKAEVKEEAPAIEEAFKDVDKLDKEAYLRSLLSGERFEKPYALFGGNAEVTFTSRLVKENEKIREALAEAALPKDKQSSVREQMQMLCSTRLFKVKGQTAVNELTADMLSEMSDILHCALLQAFRDFEYLCDALFKNYNNGPFWTATGGATSRSEHTQKGS